MTTNSEFPRIYQHEQDKLSNKKILDTFYENGSITEETVKSGATYDILNYNKEEDVFFVSYLPEVDSDDEYGKPRYFNLATSSDCSLDLFLDNYDINITTLKQEHIHMSLKELVKSNYIIRVLWNGDKNEFVLSSILSMVDFFTYEQNINE